MASFLDARANQGTWYLRIEDLDPPRETPAAARQILQTLEELNLFWDGTVLYQSQRSQVYLEAIRQLQDHELIFPCTCSRQEVEADAGIYPGTCRHRSQKPTDPINGEYALRCKVADITIQFDDLLQGPQTQNLRTGSGDFVLQRKDGLFAYQLAVVVDDAFQEISHVVRGIDLLDSSPRQIYLQGLLGYRQPAYAHIPIVINSQGQKLSKQHQASPLQTGSPSLVLYEALHYLQQQPDADLINCSPADILLWAIQHWDRQKLAGLKQLDEYQYKLTN